jgi:hypothetical protein
LGAAKGQVGVNVRINESREDVFAAGVNQGNVGIGGRQGGADAGDFLSFAEEVADEPAVGCDDFTTLYEQAHINLPMASNGEPDSTGLWFIAGLGADDVPMFVFQARSMRGHIAEGLFDGLAQGSMPTVSGARAQDGIEMPSF